ncbi:MAG: malonyl-[acyl-carrier protein] O-methyltransferase BioC [Geobacter sp.]|nr:MAG: malonyl-[acyl-carrier protein] O-methyltransferase BioC [Geobacter sp.]
MRAATDRMRIAKAFHRHADEYDQYALVQKRVVRQLDRIIASQLASSPTKALDIGCGTGAMLAALSRRYPQASPVGLDLAFNMAQKSLHRFAGKAQTVNADAEQLPFKDQTFELVVSASTFQWVRCLDLCFRECQRVLKAGGVLCAAFFGDRTLWELQECYRQTVSSRFGVDDIRHGRQHRFRTRIEVLDLLAGLGYEQVQVTTETEIEYHQDVPELLRSIKGIGAGTAASSDAVGGLGWRKVLAEMADTYRSRFGGEDKIPATYEVLYVVARKSA